MGRWLISSWYQSASKCWNGLNFRHCIFLHAVYSSSHVMCNVREQQSTFVNKWPCFRLMYKLVRRLIILIKIRMWMRSFFFSKYLLSHKLCWLVWWNALKGTITHSFTDWNIYRGRAANSLFNVIIVMRTIAMRASIDHQMSNEHYLPLSIVLNIHENNLQRKFKSSPTKIALTQKNNRKSLSFRFKQQTKWIHHHHRQTVLSRRNLLLSVCYPDYSQKVLNLRCKAEITFIHFLILIMILSIGMSYKIKEIVSKSTIEIAINLI